MRDEEIAIRRIAVVGLLACAACAASPAQEKREPKGHLVVVGGGGVPAEARKRALELAGGASAVVLVVPQASAAADAGASGAKAWTEAGAKDVSVLDLKDAKAAVESVRRATLIWMGGGDQNRLTAALAKTGVPEAMRERYEAGAVVGGTSAGAAVMSKVMITGDADLDTIEPGRTKTAEGLGLWPEAIVDQHALKRGRLNRLIGCVLDHPQLVGVGIDEDTAVVLSGRTFEVMGKSAVVVVDGRKAKGSTGLELHVLRAGDKFEVSR